MTERTRADVLLYRRGLASSRERAQALIRDGRVSVGGTLVTKPGAFFDEEVVFVVAAHESSDFASRAGYKLDPALDLFALSLEGKVVVDVGASTGGFTDAALRRGARKVYAVDVGHDQLAPRLRDDARVVVRDRTNARNLTASDFDEPVDVVLVDASFISLTKLAGAIARVLPSGGLLVALVKPQFEVGPELARRARGVIRNAEDRLAAIRNVREDLEKTGFVVSAAADSSVPGPRGNIEHFLFARRV
jgi:23S rRNA (cytidine1920-2'-O)/16S rRNA (cytidine1409-2'-O)-methyltransferase